MHQVDSNWTLETATGGMGVIDLTVSSIANEGAFTEPFGTFATVMVFATSSLKLGCLRST